MLFLVVLLVIDARSILVRRILFAGGFEDFLSLEECRSEQLVCTAEDNDDLSLHDTLSQVRAPIFHRDTCIIWLEIVSQALRKLHE